VALLRPYDIGALADILAVHNEPYLTSREAAVLGLVAEGLSYQEIGRRFGISRSRVSAAMLDMKMRLAVQTRSELVSHCQALGLLSVPGQEDRSVRKGLCTFRRGA
jgi:DNA-binding CsgD family transcriptional regulator